MNVMRRICLACIATAMVSGCSDGDYIPKPPAPLERPEPKQDELALEFRGVWQNDQGIGSWWEITPTKVVNFGIVKGKCVSQPVKIASRNSLEFKRGPGAGRTIYLSIRKGRLILFSDGGAVSHRRVPKADICTY